MYEAKSLMFLYCVSPVHMGAGQALGVVDNPIQRERHTGHPVFAGSGIKGALRDEFEAAKGKELTNRIFGPSGEGEQASDHAGCVSFSDAQLVLFPARSLRHSFVWITCATALDRLRRSAVLCGETEAVPACAGVERMGARPAEPKEFGPEGVVLESFALTPLGTSDDGARQVAQWLAKHALPRGSGLDPFAEKLTKHLVVVSDQVFNHFVTHGTVVEPHVAIDDASGTVAEGLLFYTENLPPESLLVSTVLASQERRKRGDGGGLGASSVLDEIKVLATRWVQLGGDATTGRGQVVLRWAATEGQKGGR